MTIGEKIQKYRKDLNISQEELSKKLLVSRQTISLWEKNQTQPTIDNLIRLKEIFNVSIDDILGVDNPVHDTPASEETYVFHHTEKDLMHVFKQERNDYLFRPIVFWLIFLAVIIPNAFLPDNSYFTLFLWGILLANIIFHIKQQRAWKKSWQSGVQRIVSSVYEYQFFDSYFITNIYRNNEKMQVFKNYYKDIDFIKQFDNWLILNINNHSYILNKDTLKENSFLYSYMYKNPSKISSKKAPISWRIISVILFILSLASIFFAISLWGLISSKNGLFTENMWIFFTFTPLTIGSIIFGFVAKSKGYKFHKNIVAGFIMTALLSMYGSFVFIF